jgi:hypothetical protein
MNGLMIDRVEMKEGDVCSQLTIFTSVSVIYVVSIGSVMGMCICAYM